MIVRRSYALALAVVVAASGCRITESDEGAENARVLVSGTSPVSLRLITSTAFVPATQTAPTQLVDSDTAAITPPFDQTYQVGATRRFFVRLVNPDTLASANVRLQVFLDGDERYDFETALTSGVMEFSWIFF